MIQPALLILAAGIGSRYGGFKQIDPVGPNGEIIIDYSIYDALRAGFGRIVIVTRRELEEPMREHFRKTLGEEFDLVFVFQEMDDLPAGSDAPVGRQKPWGTGHAIWAARGSIDTPFAVINADDFYGAGSYRVLRHFLETKRTGEFCLAGFELEKTLSPHGMVSRGICRVDFEGYLVDVIEHVQIMPDASFGARSKGADGLWRPLSSKSVASMNLWGFDPSIMEWLEEKFREFLAARGGEPKSEFFIPTVIDDGIRQGKLTCKVLYTDEQWFGMTYPEDREAARCAVRQLISDGVYPASLRVLLSSYV